MILKTHYQFKTMSWGFGAISIVFNIYLYDLKVKCDTSVTKQNCKKNKHLTKLQKCLVLMVLDLWRHTGKNVNPGTFYYVDIGTYCYVFITLLQKHISAVQNSNIRGLSLKVNALSCRKYALHQTQP